MHKKMNPETDLSEVYLHMLVLHYFVSSAFILRASGDGSLISCIPNLILPADSAVLYASYVLLTATLNGSPQCIKETETQIL